MGNDGNDNSLRPEAGPVPYWKHHKRAKEALNFIIRVLKDAKGAAESVERRKGLGGNLAIDTNRASRIVFVSGEPGSGKSTLYLTLKAMISSKEKEKYQVGYKGKEKVNLDNLKEVHWLDPLDLEVAGDEGENLLAAVLVRLFRALEESSTIHSKNCEDAIKELEELASDIGIAWEGNLQARAGALDPDTYSAEVMRTQGARLRINERLKESLDKLAENECYGCSPGTLFVLPVDDFYLKPAASLQLLRLLRMISIPRLFFLVMGDVKTVEALFIEKSLADWTAVAGTSLFANGSDRLDDALTRARELRARYLRKLLPPGQRTVIEAMDWYEALDFEPGHPDASVATLEDLLEGVQLDRPLTEHEKVNELTESEVVNKSLLAFLISPSLPFLPAEKQKEKLKRQKRAKRDDDAEEESLKELNLKIHRSAYTALQILDATPREMMDLGSALREVIRKRQELKNEGGAKEDIDKIPLLLLCVRDIVDLVREEQSFLSEKKQEVLEGILPTRHYSPDDITFAMDRLCLQPAPRTWKDQKSRQLWVRDHRSWDLIVNSKFISDSKNKSSNPDENEGMKRAAKDPFAKLPPRPAAWFILLHDLAWEWSSDSVTGNLVEELRQEVDNFRSTPNERAQKRKPVPFLGWAVWCDNGIYRHFPMPKFETVQDLDLFLHVWSRGLKELEKAEDNEIFSLWALAGWTIFTDAYKHFADGGDDWVKAFAKTKGTFEKRFGKSKGQLNEKGVVFEYPSHKAAKIEQWLEELNSWPKQFQSEEEASEERDRRSDNLPVNTDSQDEGT